MNSPERQLNVHRFLQLLVNIYYPNPSGQHIDNYVSVAAAAAAAAIGKLLLELPTLPLPDNLYVSPQKQIVVDWTQQNFSIKTTSCGTMHELIANTKSPAKQFASGWLLPHELAQLVKARLT